MAELADQRCVSCETGTEPLGRQDAQELGKQIPCWEIKEKSIERTFKFELRRGDEVRQPDHQDRRRGKPSSRPAYFVGKDQGRAKHAQNRRPVPKRLHPGRQDRQALRKIRAGTSNLSLPPGYLSRETIFPITLLVEWPSESVMVYAMVSTRPPPCRTASASGRSSGL